MALYSAWFAKPDIDTGRRAINSTHYSNLLAALVEIRLINTQGVYL